MGRYEMSVLAEEFGLPAGFFVTREMGERAYRALGERLREVPEGLPLVVVFPRDQLIDASFADEALIRLGEEVVAREYGERAALLEGLSEDSIHNIEAVIRLRGGKLVFLSVDSRGGWRVIGPLEPSLSETLKLVGEHERLTAPELARMLGLAVNTASNRLKRLHGKRLVRREYEVSERGLQYIYRFWQWIRRE